MHRTGDGGLRAWRAVLESSAHVMRAVDRELRASGLPPLEWYDALYPLYAAPRRRLRMNDLAEEAILLSRTGLTRLVDRLEAAGAIRREPVPGDRRGTYVVLTDDGLAVMRRMWRVYARVLRALFETPLGTDATAVSRALERVVAAAREEKSAKSAHRARPPLARRSRAG